MTRVHKGECGHDGPGESDRVSNGCETVSQNAISVSWRSEKREYQTKTKLQTQE